MKVYLWKAAERLRLVGMLFVFGAVLLFCSQKVMATEVENPDMGSVTYEPPGTTKVEGSYKKNKIKLTWSKVEDAESYYIYKKNSQGAYEQVGLTRKLTYTDKNVKKGKTYTYKVKAAYEADGQIIKGAYSKVCKVFADAVNPKKKMVALTFDDGPGPYTKDIVKCLKKNDGRATFFVLGASVDNYKDAIKEADKIGCEIGNHSYNHSNLSKLSQEEIKSQMQKTDKKVKSIIGKNTDIMRVPYGATSDNVKSAVGKPVILWSIDTLDWKTRSESKTVSAVMNNVKDGDIVLMHDIHEPTKRAALSVIPKLRKNGYQLVTVSELAKYRGYKTEKGRVYHNFYKKKK